MERGGGRGRGEEGRDENGTSQPALVCWNPLRGQHGLNLPLAGRKQCSRRTVKTGTLRQRQVNSRRGGFHREKK